MLVRVCIVCGEPMAPYQSAVYLDSGAILHVRCRSTFRGPATTSMAVIRPTSLALRRRARERRAAGVSSLIASQANRPLDDQRLA